MTTFIADFQILDELGEGSFATVYKAQRGGRMLALKVSKKKDLDRGILKSFKVEAATMRMIGHPAIVRVEEVGMHDLQPFMVMEHIRFPTLSHLLTTQHEFSEPEVIAIAIKLTETLAAVHNAGIVHRDIQPRNIFWQKEQSQLKLTDFGLAMSSEKDAVKDAAGTAAYMSPEQSGGLSIPVDYRADLYSLGALLFHLLTGQPPYRGPDTYTTIRMHLTAKTPAAREINSKVSEELSNIALRLMMKDPDDRYQSAAGLLHDLTKIASGEQNFFLGAGDTPIGKRSNTPIIGREQKLTALKRYLLARDANGTGAAIVTGLPGSGKSRLAQEALGFVAPQGTPVFHAKCGKGKLLESLRQVFAAISTHVKAAAPELRQKLATHIGPLVGGNTANLNLIDKSIVQELAPQASATEASAAEGFAPSVAALIAEIARVLGSVVLYIDDIQWIDDSSRDVIAELSQRPATDGIKLLLTARSDDQSQMPLKRVLARLPAQGCITVEVDNLTQDDANELVEVTLGGLKVPRVFSDQIYKATAGNPFSIGEYIRNALAEGILAPQGDAWGIDDQLLTEIDLPDNAVELVKRRMSGLSGDAQSILTTAAVVGSSFSTDIVTSICGFDASETERHLSWAERNSMLTRSGQEWRFFHDRVREAALFGVGTETIKNIHDLVAAFFEQQAANGGERDHLTLAHHYCEGHREKHPDLAFNAIIEAAHESVATNSMTDALNFYKIAESIAASHGMNMDPHWEKSAYAFSECGLKLESIARLEKALKLTGDRYERARILGAVARRDVERLDQESSGRNLVKAMKEIKWPHPRLIFDVLPGILSFIIGEFVFRSKWGFASLRGRTAKRARIIVELHEIFGFSRFFALDPLTGMIGTLRVYALGQWLGVCTESVKLMSSVGVLCGALKLRKAIDTVYERAKTMALAIGDPGLVSYVNAYYAVALAVYGDEIDAEKTIERIAAEEQESISPEVFVFLCAFYSSSCLMRGHPEQALNYALKGISQLSDNKQFRDHGEYFLPWCYDYAITALMTMGRYSETVTLRSRIDARKAPHPAGTYHRAVYLNNRMQSYLEQAEFSDVVEHDIEEHNKLNIFTPTSVSTVRHFYISKAYLRLNQYYQANDHEKKTYLAKLKKALRKLWICADTDLFKSHYFVIKGAVARLEGQIKKSNQHFGKAEYFSLKIRNNLALTEILIWKARAEVALENPEIAREFAMQAHGRLRFAKMFARADYLAKEFKLSTNYGSSSPRISSSSLGSSDRMPSSESGSLIESATSRAMNALIRVGRAVAGKSDPTEQANLALDETIAVIGGERAALFLAVQDSPDGPVRFQLSQARDLQKQSLEQFENYSTSMVDKVAREQIAVAYNGGDDHDLSDAASIVLHDIRSAVAAPIKVNGSLHSVIYVDTNVVKGVFGKTELQLLEAITQQVGIAIESTRAASLEVEKMAMEHDLEVTGSVQKLLIPQSHQLRTDHFELSFLYRSASRAGGDWVWYQQMENGKLVALVGDVTGHGPGPAIITGLVSGAFQVCTRQNLDIMETFHRINDAIKTLANGQMLMTLMAVELDPEKGSLRCINAGSPKLYLAHEEGNQCESITIPSNPLGMLEDTAIREKTFPFEQGARALLFTDGAYEFNAGKKHFGLRRLFQVFKDATPDSAQDGLRAIEQAIDSSADQTVQDDDITMVMIHRLSATKSNKNAA